MNIDLLSAVTKHKDVLPAAIVRAIEAAQQLDLSALAPGRYRIEGDDLFVVIQDAVTRTIDEVRTEAHFVYADVHIPISASERFGFSLPEAGLATAETPLEGNDVAYYPTPPNESFFNISPGAFVVFLPKELHRSCLAINDQVAFRKAVIKVHAKLLGL